MSLILTIDTALETASVCLAEKEQVLALSFNHDQKDHSSWLHQRIDEMIRQSGCTMKNLDAVAVTIGPGSYTGLRVGLAAAKGFCYALKIPLLTINTLKLLAFAVKEEAADLICPVIDARRMEVFTALYDKGLTEKISPHAVIWDENSFSSLLSVNKILFCGNGVEKIKSKIRGNNAAITHTMADASHLAKLSFPLFISKEYADLAYTEPFYLKEFYSSPQENS